MKTLLVSEFTYPGFVIQEIEQADGSLPGSTYWSAVDFTTSATRDEVVGKHDCLRLQLMENPKVIWEFTNATVMLYPNSKSDSNRYILTYDNMLKYTYHNIVTKEID